MSEQITIRQLASELGTTPAAMQKWIAGHGFSGEAEVCHSGSLRFLVFSAATAEKIRASRLTVYASKNIKVGQVFHRLTVTGPSATRMIRGMKFRFYPCACICGNPHVVGAQELLKGKVQSCGCLRVEVSNRAKTHGGARNHNRRLYGIWQKMRQRCNDPKTRCYSHYGGRGIIVCSEWQDFPTFRTWAMQSGYEEHLTIERNDVDGPYHPENCRWATMLEQENNRRSNVFVEAWGKEQTIAQWARDERCAVSYATLWSRLQKLFWEPERAITEPARLIKW